MVQPFTSIFTSNSFRVAQIKSEDQGRIDLYEQNSAQKFVIYNKNRPHILTTYLVTGYAPRSRHEGIVVYTPLVEHTHYRAGLGLVVAVEGRDALE